MQRISSLIIKIAFVLAIALHTSGCTVLIVGYYLNNLQEEQTQQAQLAQIPVAESSVDSLLPAQL